MVPVLDTAYIRLELEDDILVATYKKGNKITVEVARDIVQARVKFTENRSVGVLLCNQGVISFTKDARSYLSSPEGTRGIKAAAILTDTAATVMIGNFFIKVNQPPIPVKLFSNRVRAMEWLKLKS
jgi:hypothetical protein